ncbi:MAG: enoyl-CoA hydratase [Actinomycetia bacterium]|nr:enoyl-CoA hydratase [Actinomycetes bacterium]MCP4958205.1 enoyl-CoA hydratase [Actinomycetes bacterium]
MESATLYAVENGVATITLNRPDNRNALSLELIDSLAANLDDALADDEVRVIVLTNAGSTFCAGADLSSSRPAGEPSSGRTFVDVFNMILDSPKPVVGRIAGHCMGGGVGLAAVCDISVAIDSAKLGFTEVRLGVVPAIISVVCLPKMRSGDARELFLTGERISAARAAEVGIINRSTPDDQLDQELAGIITNVVRGGPRALGLAKALITRVPSMARDTAFETMAKESAALFGGDEAGEGIAAFRERRDASWIPTGE